MSYVDVLEEMSAFGRQLEGLWRTLSLLKSATTEGIDSEWEVIGTISALEDMAEIYSNKYDTLYDSVADLLKGSQPVQAKDQTNREYLTFLKLSCDALIEKDSAAYKEYVDQISKDTQDFKAYPTEECKKLTNQISEMLKNKTEN